jgi:hypothetical protein
MLFRHSTVRIVHITPFPGIRMGSDSFSDLPIAVSFAVGCERFCRFNPGTDRVLAGQPEARSGCFTG